MESHLVAAFCVFVLITTTTEGGVTEDEENYLSVLQCGEKMPDGCKVYKGRACSQRYEELNTVASNHTSWAQRVQQLHVVPVTTVTLQSRSVSLAISWLLPLCGSGVSRGVQVNVTALDDVGHYTVCHLLDLTAVSWPAANNSLQCKMTYHFPLPPLRDNYNWWVGVESVPRAAQLSEGWPHSVVSTMVRTDRLTTDPTLKPACGAVTVTYVTGPSSVTVTLHSDVLARHQAYDVILYQCFQCCQWFCQMPKVKGEYLKFPNTTARFEGVVPGSYHVWVRKAGSVIDVCARIGVLRFSPGVSTSPVATTTTTTITDIDTPTTDDSDDAQDQRPVSAGRTGISSSSSSSSNKIAVVFVAVSASFVVVTLAVMVMVFFCWRRHRGQRHRFVKDLLCLKKLISQTPRESTESYSDASPANPRVDNPSTTPVCPPSSSPLSVFLLSHSTLPPHTHATDALALYLQTCCACDVTYARWQMGSILTAGAEEWTRKQLTTSDTVIFVHSPDTQDCYDAWKLGLLKGKQNDTEVRILVTAFEQASTAEPSSSSSWFDISFCSDLFSVGGDDMSCVSPRENWRRDSRKVDAKPDQNAASEMEKVTAGGGLVEGKSSGRWFYLLLNDFSQLLADLHHLPNTPSVFKEHGLPTDSQHLETEEGRKLYKAVAILNSGPQGCSGQEASENSYRVTAGAQNTDSGFLCYSATAGGQKIDSGFQDLSFFAPEDPSVVDSESVSLAERFRAINAQYEMAMAAERGMVLPECYSLGGRYA